MTDRNDLRAAATVQPLFAATEPKRRAPRTPSELSDSRNAATARVVAKLFATEDGVDATELSIAELQRAIAAGRTSGRFQFLDGHGARADLAEAQLLLAKVRFHVGRAHKRLADIAVEYDLDAFGFGDEGSTPDPKGKTNDAARTLAVETRAA